MKEILGKLIYPDPVIVIGFLIILGLDLITGIRKARRRGEATTSKGLRRTIDKGYSYTSLVLSLLVVFNLANLSNTSDGFRGIFGFSIDAVIGFCIYIEFKSILENLMEINLVDGQKNSFNRNVITPIHNILIMKFKQKNIEL